MSAIVSDEDCSWSQAHGSMPLYGLSRSFQFMSLLTVNAGSSSLKVALYEEEGLARKEALKVERIGSTNARLVFEGSDKKVGETVEAKDHAGALDAVLNYLPDSVISNLRAAGHRIVHGGPDHAKPERITVRLLEQLWQLKQIDPTHVPQSLSVVESLIRHFPNLLQVACFDTAFHRAMPVVAQRYPLPRWTADAGVHRYGFHGLSCESIVRQLNEMNAGGGRVLIAHLGNGASITAARDGASVETSMGFSPSGGLMMGTRCGDLDPTIITYFARERTMGADALEHLVNKQSGLLGVSGVSQDMRDLLAAAGSNPQAAEAIELYCYTARKYFGALAAVLGGMDTIVFAGGIGENATLVREKICRGLRHLGVELDEQRNRANEPVISTESSRMVVRVIRTDEELVIAKHVMRLLGERRK
jgi:acetate kinase